jgi:signal transduction histidine kinase
MANVSLKKQIMLGLFGYAAMLTIVIAIQGLAFNEYVERLVWKTLLESELENFLHRKKADPNYKWLDTDDVVLYDNSVPERQFPSELRGRTEGIHDDIWVNDNMRVVLVRRVDDKLLALSLDITEIEEHELDMVLAVAVMAMAMIILLGILVIRSVNRLLQPLSKLANDIGKLEPNRAGQHIDLPGAANSELVIIADALNGYLKRNEYFVERERAFIDTASHELRTPIAVIGGSTELALGQQDLPKAARNQLLRIQRTAREVEKLVTLLLILAKDPERLASISDLVALDELLPEILEQHRHLTQGKDLTLTIAAMPHCKIFAPILLVQTAIGNLLRNAIENSDRGEIIISLLSDATVIVQDPGHGMTPEEISTIYARMAQGGSRQGGGIGLDLISRLCEHLEWNLDIASDTGTGTITTLKLKSR